MTKATPSAKRRFLFYALILFTAIIMLVGAGVLTVWLPYHREQSAIAAIEAAGGSVDTEPGGPEWLREWVGDEYMKVFDRASEVRLLGLFPLVGGIPLDDGIRIDDGILKHLAGLTSLEKLSLYNTQITDAGLEHLTGLTKLDYLSLGNTQITDAGLKHLAGLNNLEKLSLYDTQITDNGLEHLASLINLDRLSLGNTPITDAGLEHLSFTKLQHLNLDNTRVTQEGVEKLRKALGGCHISWSPPVLPKPGNSSSGSCMLTDQDKADIRRIIAEVFSLSEWFTPFGIANAGTPTCLRASHSR